MGKSAKKEGFWNSQELAIRDGLLLLTILGNLETVYRRTATSTFIYRT
jgi:hypothetical protein